MLLDIKQSLGAAAYIVLHRYGMLVGGKGLDNGEAESLFVPPGEFPCTALSDYLQICISNEITAACV
jgi:hypothetical protein